MKKILFVIFMCFIVGILLFSFLWSQKKYQILKDDNSKLIIEITDIKKNIQVKDESNSINAKEIDNLKKSNENKLKEQNIWLKMKEKLENSLS